MHILVGMDDSEPARRALAWALERAERTGTAVLALRVLPHRPVVDAGDPLPAGVSVQTRDRLAEQRMRQAREAVTGQEQEAQNELEQAVAEVCGADSPVPVRCQVTRGDSPAKTLIASSHDADLVVVGSRGRGGFTGLLLGSVSQQCAQHSACPVVVVR